MIDNLKKKKFKLIKEDAKAAAEAEAKEEEDSKAAEAEAKEEEDAKAEAKKLKM